MMSEVEVVRAIAIFAGATMGPLAGTYFGLRSALNGIKDRSVRMETLMHKMDSTLTGVVAHMTARSDRSHEQLGELNKTMHDVRDLAREAAARGSRGSGR